MDYKLISTYLDYCKTHKRLSSHTIRAYKNDLMQFYNSDYDNVESYIEQLTRSNIKTNTLRRKIACMKVFYNYLKYQNIIEENPFNQLRFQFRTEKVLPKTIPYPGRQPRQRYAHSLYRHAFAQAEGGVHFIGHENGLIEPRIAVPGIGRFFNDEGKA